MRIAALPAGDRLWDLSYSILIRVEVFIWPAEGQPMQLQHNTSILTWLQIEETEKFILVPYKVLWMLHINNHIIKSVSFV